MPAISPIMCLIFKLNFFGNIFSPLNTLRLEEPDEILDVLVFLYGLSKDDIPLFCKPEGKKSKSNILHIEILGPQKLEYKSLV